MKHTEREKTECQMRTFVRETVDAIQRGDATASAVLARLAFRRAEILRFTCPDCGSRLSDLNGVFLFTYCEPCDREVQTS